MVKVILSSNQLTNDLVKYSLYGAGEILGYKILNKKAK